MSQTLTLRPDLVLVALPPPDTNRRVGLVYEARRYAPPPMIGCVRQVGSRTWDTVAVGEYVVFGSEVGEAIDWEDWPHLLIRVQDLEAVIERE